MCVVAQAGPSSEANGLRELAVTAMRAPSQRYTLLSKPFHLQSPRSPRHALWQLRGAQIARVSARADTHKATAEPCCRVEPASCCRSPPRLQCCVKGGGRVSMGMRAQHEDALPGRPSPSSLLKCCAFLNATRFPNGGAWAAAAPNLCSPGPAATCTGLRVSQPRSRGAICAGQLEHERPGLAPAQPRQSHFPRCTAVACQHRVNDHILRQTRA